MQIHDYMNGVLCVVRSQTSMRQQHVYINSCAPVYLGQTTGGMVDLSCTFIKLVKKNTEQNLRKQSNGPPCPTHDTAVLRPSLVNRLLQVYDTIDVSAFTSYNDLLCVRMAIAKANRSTPKKS